MKFWLFCVMIFKLIWVVKLGYVLCYILVYDVKVLVVFM